VRDEGGGLTPGKALEVGPRPSGTEFAVSSLRSSNGSHVVAVSGELDLYTAPELERALAEAADGGARRLVVDLCGASFVDSTTIHVLLVAARRIEAESGRLIVVAPDPNVRRVFEITGFDRICSVLSELPADHRMTAIHHQPSVE
jgi:anti-sigma B factor antagonist